MTLSVKSLGSSRHSDLLLNKRSFHFMKPLLHPPLALNLFPVMFSNCTISRVHICNIWCDTTLLLFTVSLKYLNRLKAKLNTGNVEIPHS
jgi:hypothetical protein